MNRILAGVVIVILILAVGVAYWALGSGTAPSMQTTSTAQTTVFQVTATLPSTTTLPGTTTVAQATTTVLGTTVMPVTTVQVAGNSLSNQSAYTVSYAYNAQVGGNYLTNNAGWTLYIYTPDVRNSGLSTCYGGCSLAWPPFYAPTLALPGGFNAASFNTVKRTDGILQSSYNGMPLYFYAKDALPGQVSGQGVGGVWYVALK
jgi:predicted lipoprotein with Yx(FWY)xxD motif